MMDENRIMNKVKGSRTDEWSQGSNMLTNQKFNHGETIMSLHDCLSISLGDTLILTKETVSTAPSVAMASTLCAIAEFYIYW